MIPKYLYIPTCSQNFNNIMSSESISPAGFYERRKFGMKRFIRVEANNLQDRIALYQDIPEFNIPSIDEDNFPIYIRIDTSCYDEELFYESGLDGIYYCDQTIYITPYSCIFFFFNEADYRIVYSAQQRSLTTKMTRLYANAFCPIKKSFVVKKYDYTRLENSKKEFSEYIAKDIMINKLKGFYFAYLIGLMKDMSPSIVQLYHISNQISDSLDSILTNTHSSISQELQIEALYDDLNRLLRELSNEDELIAEAINKETKLYGIEGDLLNYLKSHGWFGDWKRQNKIPETYQVSPFLPHKFGVTIDSETKDRHIKEIMRHIGQLRGQKYPNIEELPTIMQGTLTAIPEAEFLEFVYRETMKEIFNSSDFINDRYLFSIDVCKQYKSFVGEEKFSIVRDYLNALNKNLISYMEFDINSYDNEDFRAYAAFCQKGDPDDFEKLEDYLINSEIASLHKSLAIAGMVFGYADMPKTFTKTFTQSQNHEFIKNHYRHIAAQCTGVNLSHIPEDHIEIKDKDLTAPTNPKLRDEVYEVLSQSELSDKKKESIDRAINIESRQFDSEAFLLILNNLISPKTNIYKKLKEQLLKNHNVYNSFSDFQDEIRKIYMSIGRKNQKPEYWNSIEIALNLESEVGNPIAFMNILDDYLSPKDAAYKLLKKHFGNEISRTTKATKELELSLFSEQLQVQSKSSIDVQPVMPQNKLFINDSNAYNVIKHLLPHDNKVRNQVKKDLEWFINNHHDDFKNESGQPIFYANKPIDNDSTIKRFEMYANNRLHQKQSWVVDCWKQINIPTIIEYLRTTYK